MAKTGLLIPFYVYPDLNSQPSLWRELARAARAYKDLVPIAAVINPSNGPGYVGQNGFSDADLTNYKNALLFLSKQPIQLLGYVHTSDGSRPLQDVTNDLEQYNQYDGTINGFFIDEVGVSGQEHYYESVVPNSDYYIVGNPGTAIPSSYVGIFNAAVIYEESGLPSSSIIAQRTLPYPAQNFAYVAHDIPNAPQTWTSATLNTNAVGWLWATTNYSSIPYLWNLLVALAG